MYYADRSRHLICLPPDRTYLLRMAADLGIGDHWFHGARAMHHIDIPKRAVKRVLADPKVTVLSTRALLRLGRASGGLGGNRVTLAERDVRYPHLPVPAARTSAAKWRRRNGG